MANLSVLEDLISADQAAASDNPFDDPALDDEPVEGPLLKPAPRPGLAERFTMNFEAASRYGTIGRSLQDHATEFRLRERKRFDSRYETFPQWESPAEGLVALSGQLAGAATGVENYIPIGWGVRIAKGVSWASTALRTRVMAGAIDAGATNLVIDSAIQGIEIAGETRDEFSLTQLGVSTGLGTVAGAGFGAAFGRRAPDDAAAEAPAAGSEPTQQPQNPFDDVDEAPAGALPQPQALELGPDGVLDAGTVTADQAVPARAATQVADELASEVADDATLGDRLIAQGRRARNLPEPDVPARASASAQDDVLASASNQRGAPQRREGGTGQSDAPFTRLQDVSNALRDVVNVASVRQGVTKRARPGRRILGTFNSRTGSLRIRSQDDFDTFSHEVGHDVEGRLGQPLQRLLQANRSEVEKLAYEGAAKGSELQEGFAEFFRLYMTNPKYAEREAPAFFSSFDELMTAQHGDMRDALEQVRTAYADWLKQPSDRAVAATIQPALRKGFVSTMRQDAKRHGLANTLADYVHASYGALFNNQHGLSRAVRALAQIHFDNTGRKLNLKVADDPAKIAQLSRGAQNAGHMDIQFGVHGYRGVQPGTASLRDALVEAFGLNNAYARWSDDQAREFGSYLWSRRALGEWDRFDAGEIPNPPDKLTRGDHATNVKELEAANPAFSSAADKVHEFAAGLWKKKLDAGLITPEQYEAGLQIKDYVPGLRSFDYDGDGQVRQGGKKGADARQGFVKRFRGSRRDVINPIDSLMADAYETNMAIARNDVIKTLAGLADLAGVGSSRIAERIPAIQFLPDMVDPLQVVEKAARQSGMDTIDAMAMRDAFEALVGNDKVAVFKPAIINDKGQPIVFWRDGGELQALRLADDRFGLDMYRALTSLGPQEKNLLIDLLAVPAAVLRAGITTTLEFIKANFIRDQVISWVYYGQPLKRLASTARGMGEEVFNADAARAYSQAGGIMGGAGTAQLRDSFYNADLRALKKKGWAAQRLTSLRGWLEISELSETGLRVGLFNDFRKAAVERGLDENEAAVEAAWRARDHIDFDRHGWLLAALSRVVPFLNASLQGIDKTARQAMAPLGRRAMGDSPLAGDDVAMGDAVKAWARLMVVGVTGLGIHALMRRQPEYDEINVRTRATHWMIKTGEKWYAVPKPFEMAAVINLFEAAYDTYADADPLAGERYVEGLFTVIAPPNVIEGNPAVRFYFERKSGQDFFTGRDIVPDNLKGLEPWLQYTGRTSDFSKQLGELTGLSPIQTDHFITTFTGGHGRNALALYDWALSDKPLPGWDDAPITRRFIKDASRGANSTMAFWDLIGSRTGQLEAAAKSYRSLFEGGDPAGARDYLGRQDQVTKEFVAVSVMKAGTRRLHPMLRARAAVRAINQVRRELSRPEFTGADGKPRQLDAIKRRAADDILSTMAMAEARNSMVVAGARGYEARKMLPIGTWHDELKALDADLFDALAARYASGKVIPFATMLEIWPDLRERLQADGSLAITADLEAISTAGGFELGGIRLPRNTAKPPVEALQPGG